MHLFRSNFSINLFQKRFPPLQFIIINFFVIYHGVRILADFFVWGNAVGSTPIIETAPEKLLSLKIALDAFTSGLWISILVSFKVVAEPTIDLRSEAFDSSTF